MADSMPRFHQTLVCVLLILFAVLLPAIADETMFGPAPEAKPFIDFDGKGFIINGQRTFLVSGSIHYPRVPRALWYDRLLRLKRGGFNTVQSYVFWNYHEPVENQFDFSGEKDYEAYLQTAQDLGLYATVRPGPYVCAEWDSGGYPVWTKFKPDVVVRTDSPGYTALQDHWLDKILPMVAKHQINKGGNVIQVQLENEGVWWGAWSGTASNPYYEHLHQEGIKDGLEVPFFMSGEHHGSAPVPDSPDSNGRQMPWYSTETWLGWYSLYGMQDEIYTRNLRCNEKVLARGGNGFNYYMFHGGTNFDSWNDNENAASYDYGTLVGEAGDLRTLYYPMKANNFFATSFPDILENSSDATAQYKDFATNARVIGARKSPAGTVVFIEGKVTNDDPVTIKPVGAGAGGSMHVPPLDVIPIVVDAPIVTGATPIKIVQATTDVFGIARNGTTTTLILYGQPGDTGALTLQVGDGMKKLDLTYPMNMPAEMIQKAGDQTLRILSMSRQLSDRTWIVGKPKSEYVVVGPEYVGDFSSKDGRSSMTVERPYTHLSPNVAVVYGPAEAPNEHLEVKADPSIEAAPAPALGDWKMYLPVESKPGFDDSKWKTSDDPLQMGADGDISAFAWYRASVNVPSAGPGTLNFPGAADHLIVFINGKRVEATTGVANPSASSPDLQSGNVSWTAHGDFQAGANSIAVLATHQGRNKACGYYGAIDNLNFYPKGIFKPVSLDLAGQKINVKGWKMRGGLLQPAGLGFAAVADANSMPAFFESTFAASPPGLGAYPVLRLPTTRLSRGTVYLNGRCIGRYPPTLKDKNVPVGLYLPECWFAADGKNRLVIFDEEGKSPSQIQLQVETAASREVIAVSKPADANAPINLPPYHPFNLRDTARVNPAMEKPVTASSSAPDRDAENANDGDELTEWSPITPPTPDKPAWLQIDLQQPRTLLSSEILWHDQALSFPYLIEGSLDGTNWIPLVDKHQDDAIRKVATNYTIDRFDKPACVRYVRLIVVNVLEPKNALAIGAFRVWDTPH
jgi:beta-galactosidase